MPTKQRKRWVVPNHLFGPDAFELMSRSMVQAAPEVVDWKKPGTTLKQFAALRFDVVR